MITLLNYSTKDRDQALTLLRWIGELGGASKHELVLQSSQQVLREESHRELCEEAAKHFASVEHFTPFTEDERGWPQSCNHGWLEGVIHMRELFAKRPTGSVLPAWLWLEPDCVPLKRSWLDELESGYKAGGKPFMAAEVLHPVRRLSGVAVYPAMVVSYLRHRRLGDLSTRSDKGEAWDQYYSPEWMEFTNFTRIIQNIGLQSRNPDVPPTFPDTESLSSIDPEAVLFHRCKDRTLIERLRARLCASNDGPMTSAILDDGPSGGASLSTETKINMLQSVVDRRGLFDDQAQATISDMENQIKQLKAELANRNPEQAAPARKNGKRMKQKPVRTPEEQTKINERMAKARAGRQKVAV